MRITLPDSTVRKMKALDALQGGEDKTDFSQMVSEYIDMAVTERIVRLMGLGSSAAQSGLYAPRSEFEAAEGLSSERIRPEDEEDGENPFAPPPTAKAEKVTFAAIEKDNQVEDPEHEAVSPDNEELTFGEAFGRPGIDEAVVDAAIFPEIPIIPPGKIPRSNPKPLPKAVRARVQNYTGSERDPDIT
jgi:hypothetical protein